MNTLRIASGDLAYWTVVDEEYRVIPSADAYLRHLRWGRDRAESTTRSYAGDLVLFLGWASSSERTIRSAVEDLPVFVALLRKQPIARAGSGQGQPRSSDRINHVLTVVREFCHFLVARGDLDSAVLDLLYE